MCIDDLRVGMKIKAMPLTGKRAYVKGLYTTVYGKPAISMLESVSVVDKDGHGKNKNKMVNILVKPETIKIQFPFSDAKGVELYVGDPIIYKTSAKKVKGTLCRGYFTDVDGYKTYGFYIEWADKGLTKLWKSWNRQKNRIFYGYK